MGFKMLSLFGEEIVPEQEKNSSEESKKAKQSLQEEKLEKSLPSTEEPFPISLPELFGSENKPEVSIQSTARLYVENLPEQDSIETGNIPATEVSEPELLISVEPQLIVSSDMSNKFPEHIGEKYPISETKKAIETVVNEVIEESDESSVNESGTEKPISNELDLKNEVINSFEGFPKSYKGDKQYYPIGEVAEMFKVRTSHIRYWTNEFKIRVRTTKKGDRLYAPAQIKTLQTIYHLVKEKGFTLNGAKVKLLEDKKDNNRKEKFKKSLIELRNKLIYVREQLG